MVSEAFAAIGALKSALDMAKALKNINDTVARNDAVIELQSQILTAQAAQLELTDRIRELEEEVAGFKAWDAKEQQYDLKDLGWGTTAYMLKPDARGTKPPHWVCTNCFGNHQVSIIQNVMVPNLGSRWRCPACKTDHQPSDAAFALGTGSPKWMD